MRNPRVMLVIAVFGLVPPGGCAATGRAAHPRAPLQDEDGAGGTTYSYSAGRGVQGFAAPAAAVEVAVAEAMDDLKMTVRRHSREGTVSQIDGRTADGQAVRVTLRPQHGTLRVSCRIGWFGDEPLTRTLLERVGVRLGTRPPAAIPDRPPSAPASNPFFSRAAVPDSAILRDFAEAPYRDRVDP